MRKTKPKIRIAIEPPLQGQRIGVAVSGGADSVALLRLLLELRSQAGCVLSVIHVNHTLRAAAADADEKFVARLAKTHHLEFLRKKIDIAAIAKKQKANIEEIARRERYAFFEELVHSGRVDKVAVAHTADDQAETVLAHILRGTGLAGLVGIHPKTDTVFRPLLVHRRAELRKYLRSLGQRWREDTTNRDTGRTRARIRHKLLPLLEKQFNPSVVLHLCQLAELARADESFLDQFSADQAARIAKIAGNELCLSVAELLKLDPVVQARLLRRLIKDRKPRPGQISATHIAALLELAAHPDSGKSIDLPGGLEVLRERDQLRLRATGQSATHSPRQQPARYAYHIDLSGGSCDLRLVELSAVLHFRVIDWPLEGRETNSREAVLDRNRLTAPLVVRNWQPGDAMRPAGHQKSHTLARLLNEKSVSRWNKATWPVLTSAGSPVWVLGLSVAADFAAGPHTRTAVVVTEEPYT